MNIIMQGKTKMTSKELNPELKHILNHDGPSEVLRQTALYLANTCDKFKLDEYDRDTCKKAFTELFSKSVRMAFKEIEQK